MSKFKIVSYIILCIFGVWVFTIFPGRYFEAKISTLPFLNKFKLLSPQAPIVINNKETIRISDSGDAAQAAQDAKQELSLIVYSNSGSYSVVGSAINLTSDGTFITASTVFSPKNPLTGYFIMLNDGTVSKIVNKVDDSATNLAFIKADLKNVPVISTLSSKNLTVAEKLLFVKSSLTPFNVQAELAYIYKSQSDLSQKEFLSDYPSRGFVSEIPKNVLPGQAILNTSAELVGIWNGAQIISSDVLKEAQGLYFGNNLEFIRPSFGFSYFSIDKNEAFLINSVPGLLVKSVEASGVSQKAGLQVGDVVTKINGQDFSQLTAEEILQKFKPQEEIMFTIFRKGKFEEIKLIAGQLK